MKTLKTLSAIMIVILAITSCKKEGTGGTASITGIAKHHSKPIPNAVIYIKYGAKESAGTNPANYDASVTADGNAKYEFTGLNKGNYYLYGIGYDSSITNTVTGGVPAEIKKKSEIVQMDVPITE
ncbi:MAG: hypothetical protein IT233_09235 [Bacteroidia bacterium]|nr:hypothetical protein [Bacteroidia bacterium]